MADITLADGTYKIFNGANPSLLLNSCGATDGNSENVWLYRDDSSDAVYVRVWTRSDGSRQLCFAATGKCVDVRGGTIAHGTNVQQYSANDTNAQRWVIEPVDGKSIAVRGTAYQAYKVWCQSTYGKSTAYLMEAQGTGTPSQGTNVCISEDEGASSDQTWAFVPADPAPTGTYIIRPRVNPKLALDVSGSSHSIGARVFLSGEHVGTGVDDGRNPVVWLREYDSTGRAKLAFCHSMMLMELPSTNSAKAGAYICQCTDNGGTDQQWVITPHGSMAVDGTQVPLHVIRNAAASGTSLVLDVYCGGTTPGTYMQVWPQNFSVAQDFWLEPCSMPTSSIPAPSALGFATSADAAPTSAVMAQDLSGGVAYAVWSGPGTSWQVRYRTMPRRAGSSDGTWGEWQSAADGSVANAGWGTEWRPNVTTADGGTHRVALSLPTVDGDTVDWVAVQVEVRRLEAGWQGHDGLVAHGPSCVIEGGVAWRPTITLSSVGWSPEGLVVGYATDLSRGGNTVTVSSVVVDGSELVASPATETGLASSDSVTVPMASVTDVPEDGAPCAVAITVTTDHATATATLAGHVAWSAGSGITVTPTCVATDRLTVEVTCYEHKSDRAWLVGSGSLVEMAAVARSGGKVTFEAEPPLGAPYRVCVASRSGSSWGTSVSPMPSVGGGTYVWNWTDSGGARRAAMILMAHGDTPPERDESYKADSTSLVTSGSSRPVYRIGSSLSADLGTTGAIYADDGRNPKWSRAADFRALAAAGHAVFRDAWGMRATVAVTGLSMPRSERDYIKVTVEQSEEEL